MICSYSAYIEKYLLLDGFDGEKSPGEHHFVATYLLPRVEKVMGKVADYVNPDGMKEIAGDIVYWENKSHHVGIEVKHETISLTNGEYNKWIVNFFKNESMCPKIFIGICAKGVIILPWQEFRDVYLYLIKKPNPTQIYSKYGPKRKVHFLFEHDSGNGYLRIGNGKRDAQFLEKQFMKQLCKLLTDFKTVT